MILFTLSDYLKYKISVLIVFTNIASSIAESYDFKPMEPSALFIAFCLRVVDEGFM